MNVNLNNLTKRKLFSGYYQNVRDLRTKLNCLHHNVPLMNYDLLIFTETMFYDIIENDELGSLMAIKYFVAIEKVVTKILV